VKTPVRSAIKRALGIISWNSDDDQCQLIPGAKTIFDVGANVGQTSKIYRRMFPSADIWAFEPFPENFAVLRQALRDNHFHPAALAFSDQVGPVALNIGGANITHSLLRRETDTGKTVQIQSETIDHFCAEHGVPVIDILKVDVEGAESRVFMGARAMFSRRAVRSVFVEVYFEPVYEGMALMWDLHAQLCESGFRLAGLYSLRRNGMGFLSFGNALYLQAD
jgi:FkbM family methyltransferase